MSIFNNPANDIQLTIFESKRGKFFWVARQGSMHVGTGNLHEFDDAHSCEKFARTIFRDVKYVTHRRTTRDRPRKLRRDAGSRRSS